MVTLELNKNDPPDGNLREDNSRYRKQQVQRPEAGTGRERTSAAGSRQRRGQSGKGALGIYAGQSTPLPTPVIIH